MPEVMTQQASRDKGKDTGRILLHAALLLVFTVPFWIFNLDLKVESALYSAASGRFIYADNPFFVFLYRYGTLPALIFSAAAIAVFVLSFIYDKAKKKRKAAALVLLTMLIGPGLIINVVLKNYTGRPRPRETREFGGKWDFRQPLVPGDPGKGFSFPCGHCSTGFVFYTLFLIYRKKNKGIAGAALAGSFVFGGAMGLARMAQGAHFASDVLWAGGITILTAEVLHYRIIKTDVQGTLFENIRTVNKPVVFGAAGLLIMIMTLFFLFATPFYRARTNGLQNTTSGTLHIECASGDITVLDFPGKGGLITLEASGFGLPSADYIDSLKIEGDETTFRTVRKGLFSELNADIKAGINGGKNYSIDIINKNGSAVYTASCPLSAAKIRLYEGNTVFSPSGGSAAMIDIECDKGDVTVNLPENFRMQPSGMIKITSKKGIITFINRSDDFRDVTDHADKFSGSRDITVKPLEKGAPSMELAAGKILVKEK
jgi:membrane-associated PAP2 superfamily phosphatase